MTVGISSEFRKSDNIVFFAFNYSEFLRIIHREWVQKHGNIYRGWGGTRAIVCIASPELMEVLYQTNFSKK